MKSLAQQPQQQDLQVIKQQLMLRLESAQNLTNSEKNYVLNHKTTLKFREVQPEFVLDFADRINELAFDFGIKQEIETAICVKISKTLIEEFKDFSIDEIFEAAKKYSLQQLDFKESHFQDLSIAFISKVLISYKRSRNKALTALKKEEERLHRLEEEKADEERRAKLIKPEIRLAMYEVRKAYRKAQENKKNINVPENAAVTFFRMMLQEGFKRPSRESLQEYRVKGYDDLRKGFTSNEKLFKAFEKMNSNKAIYDPIELNFQMLIKNRAAKIYVDECLDLMIKEGKKIDDFLQD